MTNHRILISEMLLEHLAALSKDLQKNIGLGEYAVSMRSALNAEARLQQLQEVERCCGNLWGKKILEVGSGVGMLALVGKLLGLDIQGSEPAHNSYGRQFQATQQLLTDNAVSSNLIKHTDGCALPWEDASFDLVIGFQVVEHVTEPAAFFDEIKRVLKPGGQIFMDMPNHFSFAEGHFGLAWFPFLAFNPNWAKIWVKYCGRNPDFIDELNLIRPSKIRHLLMAAGLDYQLFSSAPLKYEAIATADHSIKIVLPPSYSLPEGSRYTGKSLSVKKFIARPTIVSLLSRLGMSEHLYLHAGHSL